MILTALKLIPRVEKRREMIEILTRIESRTQLIFGCESSSVFVQVSPEQAILYVETWLSEEELHRHIQSDLYLWILAAMELASEPPEICFHQISDTRGLEMVESLRGSRQIAQ
jgi:quinol monooxygenase YgiN